MDVVRKRHLDGQVAEILGKKTSEVSLITQTFLKEVLKELVDSRAVRLDGVGELRLTMRKTNQVLRMPLTSRTFDIRRKYFVSFRKAQPLHAAILDRYGAAAKRRK